MLTIRPEQMARFKELRVHEFATRMVEHVCAEYPGEAATLGGPDAVMALVRRVIVRGEALGFTTERDVAGLIDLTVVYGEGFETAAGDPEISEILQDREISPQSRIDLVLERLPD